MEIEGTKEAFKRLLEVPALYKYLDVDTSTVANWKRYLRDGKLISTDKMEEMLLKFGAKVKQEKVWIMNIQQYSDKWVSVKDRLPNIDAGKSTSRAVLVKTEVNPDKMFDAVYSREGWIAATGGTDKFPLIVTEWLDGPIEKR